MDMLRRRSEPGLSSAANEAEENRGDGGEERQQMVQALTDGREVAMIQPTSQVENEVVPVPAANPFWSERAHEEMRLRQSRPASLLRAEGIGVVKKQEDHRRCQNFGIGSRFQLRGHLQG